MNLTNSSQLAHYIFRLNQVVKVVATQWNDPATNAVISPSADTFQFGFVDFEITLGYRSIPLNDSPVPEPMNDSPLP